MPLFAVIGLDHPPHAMDRRNMARDAHRPYVIANDADLALVGVCLDDEGIQCASLYVFDAESEQQVRNWLAQEPFVRAGVYEQLIVRRVMFGVNRLPPREWVVPSGS